MWELHVANLLTKNPNFQIEYERYGVGGHRTPDYRVATSTRNFFNVEATWIRECPWETRLNKWHRGIRQAVQAVPSRVKIFLIILSMDKAQELLEKLETGCDRIKTKIVELIVNADAYLKEGESQQLQISGFNGLVQVDVSKPESITNQRRTAYSVSFPIEFTQNEFRKFGDIVFAKVGQFFAGMANILLVGSRSVTHDERDCEEAIGELERMLRDNDNAFFQRKGFKVASDFNKQYRNISAIIFCSAWTGDKDRNFVWLNPQASNRLDARVVDFFHSMD